MEKIKIFIGLAHQHSELEDKINNFIADKKVINMKQSMTDYGFSNGTRKIHIMFTIVYSEL